MTITVRFFASLRERLGRGEDRIASQGIATAADVWQRAAGVPLPPSTLVAINQEYARLDQPVRDGDEVAFFPPVTGGGV
jgi:molybdopterin synthase sulfur carrier subunit